MPFGEAKVIAFPCPHIQASAHVLWPSSAIRKQLEGLSPVLCRCRIVAIQQASAACWGAGGDGVLSGGFEAGWHPGMAVEQVAEGGELADAPFGGGGQVELDDGEIGESFDGAPASSGAALLDLDGADCSLGLVVGEDVQVGAGREAQDHVLEVQEPAGDPPGVLRGCGAPVGVGGQPGRGQRPVPGEQVVQDAGVQGCLSRATAAVR